MASKDLVFYSDLTLLVPYAVSMTLLEQKTVHLQATEWLHRCMLLEMPNITTKLLLLIQLHFSIQLYMALHMTMMLR